MSGTLWRVKNPYTLPMSIERHRNGRVTAAFPALGHYCVGVGSDADEAILSAAKLMQRIIEDYRASKGKHNIGKPLEKCSQPTSCSEPSC